MRRRKGYRSCLLHKRTHTLSLWSQFQPSVLSGGAVLEFWLYPSYRAASSLLSLPEPNCCYFVPCQGGGNCSDSRSEKQDRVVVHREVWRGRR